MTDCEMEEDSNPLKRKNTSMLSDNEVKKKKILVTQKTLHVSDDMCKIIHPKNSVCYKKNQNLEELQQKGIEVRTGKWLKEEDDMLIRNWENFLKENPIEDPYRLFKMKTETVKSIETYRKLKQIVEDGEFYICLSKNLNRSTGSCYCRARKLLDKCEKVGPLSEEEITKLKELHEYFGNKWTTIGLKMGRSGQFLQDYWRRYQKDIEGGKTEKGLWTEKEIRQLKRSILKVTGKNNLSEVNYTNLPWGEIAKEIPTRNAQQCRSEWLFGVGKKDTVELGPRGSHVKGEDRFNHRKRSELIELIYGLNVQEESDINWEDLYTHFPELKSPQHLRRKWIGLKKKISISSDMSFKEVVDKVVCQFMMNNDTEELGQIAEERPYVEDKDIFDYRKSSKLIELIYGLDIEMESDINWEDLYTHFPDLKSPRHVRKKWVKIKKQITGDSDMSFKEVRDEALCRLMKSH